MERPWFPIRVLAIFSVFLVPFDGLSRFPFAEKGGMTIRPLGGRAASEMMSLFNSLTPFYYA
jgi:hypothetical protein